MTKIENNECLNDFGNYIRKAREEQGLYQKDVAERVGIQQNYYSEIENGLRKGLTFPLALRICKELNINVNDFMLRYVK